MELKIEIYTHMNLIKMKKKKAIFKYNGGDLALLCSKCRVIIKRGFQFSEEELKACTGDNTLPPQYCDKCKVDIMIDFIAFGA